jgi:dihydrofolate reductase
VRKLVVIEFLSVDGVMQGLGSPDEDTEGGFAHGGWGTQFGDEVLGADAAQGLATTDAYLFGRKTYEKMAAFWPNVPGDDPFAAHLNATPKYVASRTLRSLEWRSSALIEGDVATAVTELKQKPGNNIAVLGSGHLVQTLIKNDLVDEYRLFVHPILLGGGKRLFRDDPRARRLRLVESKATPTGSLILTYQPA